MRSKFFGACKLIRDRRVTIQLFVCSRRSAAGIGMLPQGLVVNGCGVSENRAEPCFANGV